MDADGEEEAALAALGVQRHGAAALETAVLARAYAEAGDAAGPPGGEVATAEGAAVVRAPLSALRRRHRPSERASPRHGRWPPRRS